MHVEHSVEDMGVEKIKAILLPLKLEGRQGVGGPREIRPSCSEISWDKSKRHKKVFDGS